jgi:hypothetical protein
MTTKSSGHHIVLVRILSGVLVSYGLIDQGLYFDIFNPTPFWDKVRPEGMRVKRSYIYENFELLTNKRLSWTKKEEGW